ALGYLNRADLTDRAFRAANGRRVYRTGDLCRQRQDGTLEYVGRADREIKTRGCRIHPAEIERALRAHAGIAEAPVVGDEQSGQTRIVAYVVATTPKASLVGRELRGFLRDRLPEHMIPSRFVQLTSLPRTPNNKVDRFALPVAGREGRFLDDEDESFEPAEERLAAIWTEVLGLSQVGARTGFFEVGGNSLLAI